MSYDVRLKDPVTKQTIELRQNHFITGGMFCVGGTKELWLNITWNYAPIYYRSDVLGEKGIRGLDGMTAAQSIPLLKKAIAVLKDDVDPDYWKGTEGNAKKALYGLLAFAQMRPDGVWEVNT